MNQSHLAVLGLLAGGILALVLSRRRLRGRHDVWVRRLIVVALGGNELSGWVLTAANGVVYIPLQLCDLALILALWALWSPRPKVAELAYFWGLAGSVQAILTPDLREAFPSYWWVNFFVGHCGIVLSVVYLAVTGRVAPTHRSVWRVVGWTNIYAAAVGLVNRIAGTNYGYLAHKPMQPSLLDAFGPWPWYIVGMEMAAVASCYLAYAPFALVSRGQVGDSPL